ncbi:hypothetical protein AYI70_g8744 [Smittium culicis]|uniref:Uncharacterized protein n=1 Tax=Smittium culicis TaxID=133412 RepID=A0A1R1XEK0_9FUNG|nr:hypothetical protein AYI70_g8744 [Smittium culicis]
MKKKMQVIYVTASTSIDIHNTSINTNQHKLLSTVTSLTYPSVTVTTSPSITITPSISNSPSIPNSPSDSYIPSIIDTSSILNTHSSPITLSTPKTYSGSHTPSIPNIDSIINTDSITINPILTRPQHPIPLSIRNYHPSFRAKHSPPPTPNSPITPTTRSFIPSFPLLPPPVTIYSIRSHHHSPQHLSRRLISSSSFAIDSF